MPASLAAAKAGPGLRSEDRTLEGVQVARCQAGEDRDQAAFRWIYERHAPEVLRFLRRLLPTREEAEDAAQETFVRAHRGLPGFDPGRPLRPWLLRIARNAAIDALRRGRKAAAAQAPGRGQGGDEDDPARLAAPQGDAPSERALQAERSALIADALQALLPEHRAVVLLRYAHGLTWEEVGLALDCTPRTARNRLRAAAVLLARELRRRGTLESGARREDGRTGDARTGGVRP